MRGRIQPIGEQLDDAVAAEFGSLAVSMGLTK